MTLSVDFPFASSSHGPLLCVPPIGLKSGKNFQLPSETLDRFILFLQHKIPFLSRSLLTSKGLFISTSFFFRETASLRRGPSLTESMLEPRDTLALSENKLAYLGARRVGLPLTQLCQQPFWFGSRRSHSEV